MKAALLQMTSGDDPEVNLTTTLGMVAEAAAGGADMVFTPEVTNCVSSSRTQQNAVLRHEEDDPTLAGLRQAAAEHQLWISIGSLGLLTTDADGRFANRSFMIAPTGEVVARYDKIHMFDVDVTPEETFRESDGYRPGDTATVVETAFGRIGMTVCYDIRFPYLHRALAKAGAEVLTVPAAFSPVTGAAHWEVLLRARAIETGCFVVAAAQTGRHEVQRGKPRSTHGHSMVVAPWGEVLLDAGTDPGVHFVEIDLTEVSKARQRIPALTHDRPFAGP